VNQPRQPPSPIRAQEIEDLVVCITKLDLFGEADKQQKAFENAKSFVVDLLTQHRFLQFDQYLFIALSLSLNKSRTTPP
jgi:uncharacterized protein YqcC (DUF446 family)